MQQQEQPAAVSRLTGPFSRAALVPHVPIKFFSDYTHSHMYTTLRNNGAAVSTGVMLVSGASATDRYYHAQRCPL